MIKEPMSKEDKKLLYLFIALFLCVVAVGLLIMASEALSKPPSDVQMLRDFILSPFSKQYLHDKGTLPGSTVTYHTLSHDENLSDHNNFQWRMASHFVTLYCYGENCFLRYQVKDYREFVSPDSRGFTFWTIYDQDMDGKPDKTERRFIMVMQDNVLIMPDYPPGYIDQKWFAVSHEEATARLKTEMLFWLGLVKQST